ncbi:MAG: prenyltransferase/squalene oxidase repeat-containing protein [Syntrophales bacterium]
MEPTLSPKSAASSVDVPVMGDFIASLQKANGEIPWSAGGKTDPWDHVESAMGLSVAGRRREAEKAYGWVAAAQLPDGSWWSATRDGVVEDATKDSNVSSYIAVGVYQHFLITGDIGFLERMWPTLEGGVDYAVGLQADTGEIHWARNSAGIVDRMALLTGSSSVYMSLKCAIAAASLLEKRRTDWEAALAKLGEAIRFRPSLFNMIKSRYSMDWYYPILCGAITGEEASRRIDRSWEKFVVPGWGVRCVSDQPWVTTAEASELVLALMSIGEAERAAIVFNWICDKKYDDGSYWMGVTFPDGVIWPEERTSWTAAAVLLAHDALYDLTPASRLFSHRFWQEQGDVHRIARPVAPGLFGHQRGSSFPLPRG